MESSSSDDLSSDSEVYDIVESVWEKTKASFPEEHDTEELNDDTSDLEDKHSSNLRTENEGDRQRKEGESSLFSIDKTPATPKPNQTTRHKQDKLSSSLQVKQNPSDIYIDYHSDYTLKPKCKNDFKRLANRNDEVMKKSIITPDFEQKHAVPSYTERVRQTQKERKKEREKTKGRGWFNMPRGDMTEETKNDLMALKMRRALDPKTFYKSDDIKGLPKYFQFGTVVEDPSEFYSARIPKKQRRKTIVEELMADADFNRYNKRKYAEVQELKAKGLGPYKGLRTSRTKKKSKWN